MGGEETGRGRLSTGTSPLPCTCPLSSKSVTLSLNLYLCQSLSLPLVYILRAYAAQLSSYRSHCDSILNEVESALRQLQDLQHKHLLVSTKTGALHEACEQLLQDQVWQIVQHLLF